MKLSDALLFVSRFLTNKVEGHKLTWLNRELLGYLKEDLEPIFDERKKVSEARSKLDRSLPVPSYRFLTGAWGRQNSDGMVIHIEIPRLKEKKIFCNIGIQQIETQLSQLDDPAMNVYCMSFDPTTGAQFYCYAEELDRLYLSVSNRLIDFIDSISPT